MKFLRTILIALLLAALPSVHVDNQGQWTVQSAYAVEVDLQWPAGTQFFKDDGSINDSGLIVIYDAGTTDLRTTYSDSGGTVANTLNGSNQIVLGTDGRLTESVYIPTGSWKFIVYESDGSTVTAQDDNLEGALDTSVFATGSVAWTLPVLSKTANYTVTTSDLGKCINANPTGGAFTLTLPSAATAGDGKTFCARHVGTSNQVTVATVSSQSIDAHVTHVLSNQYESILLVSDGANWHIAARADPQGRSIIQITDRLTAPPGGPAPGACYILNGTGTGDWSSFSEHDVLCANGSGGWLNFTPREPWVAYVSDEAMLTQYRSTAWVDLSGATAAATDNVRAWYGRYEEANAAAGDTASAAAWTQVDINTEVINTITGGVSVSQGGQPPGWPLHRLRDRQLHGRQRHIRIGPLVEQ